MIFIFYRKALLDKSFYFLLIVTLYFYIGVSYLVLHVLDRMSSNGIGLIYIGFLYFIVSGIGLVMFLVNINKKIKVS